MNALVEELFKEQKEIFRDFGRTLAGETKNVNNVNVDMKSSLSAKELSFLTGISEEKCQRYMDVNCLDGDQALESIDIFMECIDENIEVPVEIAICMNNAGIYSEMAGRLGAYNTMRGGTKGYGGFVFEELHAASESALKGTDITVLGNNGVADFIVKDAAGKETLLQAKAGYGKNKIDWSKYEGQTIVVDKGNTVLIEDAKRAGLKVQESSVFKKQADIVARTQQFESKITGSKTAPITATTTSAHYAGLASAKLAARVGVSMKMGENIYDVMSGDKRFEDAAADVIVDGLVITGGAYIGTAALTVAGTAATAAATAVAGTTVGATVAGTAVGGAVVAGVGAAATTATAVVGAVAAAPLVPVVAAGAAIGFVGKLIKGRR